MVEHVLENPIGIFGIAWAVLNVYPDSNDLIGVTIDQLKRIDGVSHANAEAIKHHFG